MADIKMVQRAIECQNEDCHMPLRLIQTSEEGPIAVDASGGLSIVVALRGNGFALNRKEYIECFEGHPFEVDQMGEVV